MLKPVLILALIAATAGLPAHVQTANPAPETDSGPAKPATDDDHEGGGDSM